MIYEIFQTASIWVSNEFTIQQLISVDASIPASHHYITAGGLCMSNASETASVQDRIVAPASFYQYCQKANSLRKAS
jgi:hypothetical protein